MWYFVRGLGPNRSGSRPNCLRRASLLYEKVRRHRIDHLRPKPSDIGLAQCTGAVGLFRSPNLSSAIPMTPAYGLDAGAVKAGLIQFIGGLLAGLERRKVLLSHKVTANPSPSFTPIPGSQTACEFACDTFDSIATTGSLWRIWRAQEDTGLPSSCAGFVRRRPSVRRFATVRSMPSALTARTVQSAPASQTVAAREEAWLGADVPPALRAKAMLAIARG